MWVCAGCEKCQEESTDGVTPGASIPHDSPCTDTSPSINGMVVVSAEDYDALAAALARRVHAARPYWNVGGQQVVWIWNDEDAQDRALLARAGRKPLGGTNPGERRRINPEDTRDA